MEEPCALVAHARFCEGCEIQSPEREKGFRLLDRNQRESRDPGLSVAREAARRSPAGKRPPGTEINGILETALFIRLEQNKPCFFRLSQHKLTV